VRIVEWQARHRGGLERLLGPPDDLLRQSRPVFGPAVDGPRWRFTLVAEADGEPVGSAVAFVPRWHAQRVWISVEVADGRRREGIGSALLEAVRERCRSDGRPLRGKVFAGSPAAAFADARGFKVIQRSRTFRLDNGEAVSAGEFVIEAPAAPSAAAAAFRDFYVSSHNWDPPGPMTIEDIMETHIAEAVELIVVRSPAGEALAVGCLYDEDGELSFSGGPTDPADPRTGGAAAALLDALPKPVLIEADDSVPSLLAALSTRGARVIDETHVVAEA
jgi:GNAT superfamily N-acetyltransferase